jgi:hypothetical protein
MSRGLEPGVRGFSAHYIPPIIDLFVVCAYITDCRRISKQALDVNIVCSINHYYFRAAALFFKDMDAGDACGWAISAFLATDGGDQ